MTTKWLDKGLKYAEPIFLSLSAFGSIVAILCQQMTYATAPLTFTFLINWINRQQYLQQKAEQTNQLINSGITQFSEPLKNQQQQLIGLETLLKNQVSKVELKLIPQLEEINQKTNFLFEIKSQLKTINSLSDFTSINQSLKNINTVINQNLATKDDLSNIVKFFDSELLDNSVEFIFGYEKIRDIFSQALKEAKNELVLVCPWIGDYGIDDTLFSDIKSFVEAGGKLKVGWGHKKDINNFNLTGNLSWKSLVDYYRDKDEKDINKFNRWWRYGKISDFYVLKDSYPERVFVKLIGTHEKYLICDDKYTVITSHNFLTSGINKNHPDLEIGVKITNKEKIHELRSYFDKIKNLDNPSIAPNLTEAYSYNQDNDSGIISTIVSQVESKFIEALIPKNGEYYNGIKPVEGKTSTYKLHLTEIPVQNLLMEQIEPEIKQYLEAHKSKIGCDDFEVNPRPHPAFLHIYLYKSLSERKDSDENACKKEVADFFKSQVFYQEALERQSL